MRKIVDTVSDEGLKALLGEKVLLICLNYIYSGTLKGVAEDCVALAEPAIVYETGEWAAEQYKDVQRLPCEIFYVNRSAIESFGKGK